jgi:DNA-binding winged helix-turn-helix (wHTH) protein
MLRRKTLASACFIVRKRPQPVSNKLLAQVDDGEGNALGLVFGDYVLEIERRELRRAGAPVALPPQIFDLIVYLVQNRDRVVSKNDLLEAVWSGRIVSDSAMTTAINAARRAIGDNGEKQALIRTIHRKGIRFIGEVTEDDVDVLGDAVGEEFLLGLAAHVGEGQYRDRRLVGEGERYR